MGLTSTGSPEATPASTGRLLTHGGLSAGRESGPSRGPHHCLDLSPALARASRPGTRSRAGGVLVATWSETLQVQGSGETRSGQAFPAVVISAGSSGWEREPSLFSRSFLPRDAGSCSFSPDSQQKAPRKRGVGSLRKWEIPKGHPPEVGIWLEEVAYTFLCPRVGCQSAMLGWDSRAGGGDSSPFSPL